MDLVESIIKAGTYVGEGIGTVITAAELSQSIAAIVENNSNMVYHSFVGALFFGAVTVYCSEYRAAIEAKNVLKAELQRLEYSRQ